ncbi:hypothetical protein ABLB96_11270 [Acinetobacter sp. XH1741]|uniref:hypothetical protein n=1 Tax=unclassified Acinetobacter TaxID=196816 RepID=UPI0032B52CD2
MQSQNSKVLLPITVSENQQMPQTEKEIRPVTGDVYLKLHDTGMVPFTLIIKDKAYFKLAEKVSIVDFQGVLKMAKLY